MMKHSLLSRVCLAVPASLLLAGVASAQTVITVTEQTQAGIQSALNQLGGPGTVFLPSGRYLIDGTLRIRTNGVTLQGAGGDQTVLYRLLDGTNTAMVRSTDNANVRVTGIRFEGVSNLDPDLGELSTGREVGVLLENAPDFRVDNCSWRRTSRSARAGRHSSRTHRLACAATQWLPTRVHATCFGTTTSRRTRSLTQ